MSRNPKVVVPGLNRGAGIPAGYLLGRARNAGHGPAQLLDLIGVVKMGVQTVAGSSQGDIKTGSTAHSETVSLSTSNSSSLSQISSSLSGAVSINVGQSTSLSQVSSSLSGAISSTSSLSTAVSTVISGSISAVNSRIDSLSTAGGGGGATTFLALTDTPATYVGQTGKVAAVNGAETALEFVALPGGTGQSTSLSQISSSLSGAISSTASLSSAVSTVISGSISTTLSTAASATASLSTAIGGGGGGGALTQIGSDLNADSLATTFSFTSIPNTYKGLIVWCDFVISTASLIVRVNNDSSGVAGSSGKYQMQRTGHSNGAINLQQLLQTGWNVTSGLNAAVAVDFELRMLNYAGGNKKAAKMDMTWATTGTGNVAIGVYGLLWDTATAVSELDFIFGAAPTGGKIRLFGIN